MKITSVNFEKCRFSRKKGRRLLDIELRNKKKLTLKLLPLNKDLGQNRAASLNAFQKFLSRKRLSIYRKKERTFAHLKQLLCTCV